MKRGKTTKTSKISAVAMTKKTKIKVVSSKSSNKPEGELVLQTVAMPSDTNAYGDIFGGWLVSQMDLGGAILAHRQAKNRVTTVAIDSMSFIKPVFVGDLVCCYAKKVKTGRSSIHVKLQVWVQRLRLGNYEQVTEGLFVYVALDKKRRPKTIRW
jgi:acyl-CoA thioesterase YciA